MDVKRVCYLLLLALVVGLVLVHLQTMRIQTVWQLTALRGDEQELRGRIWQQQAILSERMDSPRRVKALVTEMGLMVGPAAGETEEQE